MKKTPNELAACSLREYKLRKRNYPRWVREGAMTLPQAQHELDCMKEIMRMLASSAKAALELSGHPFDRENPP